MGIFNRLKNIATAEINGLLDQVEDPINMLNQYVREMEEEISKGEHALANQIFLEKRQRESILSIEEVIAKRTRQAQLAVDQEEDQIAKLALQDKLIHEEKLTLYKEQYATIKNQTKMLQEKLNQLKEKCDELKHKRLLLISRANVAQSIKQINHTVNSLDTDHISKSFARMEERVFMMEAEVEASNRQSLPGRYLNNLSLDPMLQEEVQKELAKLKEKSKETA